MTGQEINLNETAKEITMPETGYLDIKPQIEMSPKDLKNAVKEEFDKAANEVEVHDEHYTEKVKPLTNEEREVIKDEIGWPDEIIDYIDNMEQYSIYKNADLHVEVVDGRYCLCKNIDMDYIDPKTGLTNRQLMQDGRSPIDSKTGEKITLHHPGQKYDAPFIELCEKTEHGDGNDRILHPNTEGSWRNDPQFLNNYNNVERPNHWKSRVKEV